MHLLVVAEPPSESVCVCTVSPLVNQMFSIAHELQQRGHSISIASTLAASDADAKKTVGLDFIHVPMPASGMKGVRLSCLDMSTKLCIYVPPYAVDGCLKKFFMYQVVEKCSTTVPQEV